MQTKIHMGKHIQCTLNICRNVIFKQMRIITKSAKISSLILGIDDLFDIDIFRRFKNWLNASSFGRRTILTKFSEINKIMIQEKGKFIGNYQVENTLL